MNLNRGDVKLIYDRCVAHDVEDVGVFILDLVEYIQKLREELDKAKIDSAEKLENSINEAKETYHENQR